MGLDMIAFKTMAALDSPTPAEVPQGSEKIHDWRKYPNLHGWMKDLFHSKGGYGDFNLQPVVVTSEDLDELEKAVNNKVFPYTSGFFFGESCDEYATDDKEFIRKAREAISQGYTVLYDSWW